MTAMGARLADIARGITDGSLIPYLGPGLLGMVEGGSPVPDSTRALAQVLSGRVPVPGRIRTNVWAAAQYIESRRHRVTLDRLMADAFRPVPAPTPLHRWLATLPGLRLVVDTWYDATLTTALSTRRDWGLVQGANRVRIGRAEWVRYFAADGSEVATDAVGGWDLVVYKPHGGAWPAGDVLISDSDYVEALTELDIQSPIPAVVQDVRTDRGFVFLGCRFHDQILRGYARQIMKRSAGPHFALLPSDLTANERRFLDEQGIEPLFVGLDDLPT
ncbi:MAG: SIR2 family protein [Alphaproteobacteria bacterium]